MRRRKWTAILLATAICLGSAVTLSGCGSMHSYWGVENDYYTDFDGGHHHHKPPKHKKYKKHKKHKKHHHHDDDD